MVLPSFEAPMESLARRVDTNESDSAPAALPLTARTPAGIDRIVPAAPSPARLSASAPGAISATERRLKQIIETAPVSLVVLDEQGRLLAANRAALSLLGLERSDHLVGAGVE